MVRHLSEHQRIEILMMIGYGERTRTQLKVCNLLNNKYPKNESITPTTISKLEQKFNVVL